MKRSVLEKHAERLFSVKADLQDWLQKFIDNSLQHVIQWSKNKQQHEREWMIMMQNFQRKALDIDRVAQRMDNLLAQLRDGMDDATHEESTLAEVQLLRRTSEEDLRIALDNMGRLKEFARRAEAAARRTGRGRSNSDTTCDSSEGQPQDSVMSSDINECMKLGLDHGDARADSISFRVVPVETQQIASYHGSSRESRTVACHAGA